MSHLNRGKIMHRALKSFDLIDGKIRTLVLLALGFDQTQNIDPPE